MISLKRIMFKITENNRTQRITEKIIGIAYYQNMGPTTSQINFATTKKSVYRSPVYSSLQHNHHILFKAIGYFPKRMFVRSIIIIHHLAYPLFRSISLGNRKIRILRYIRTNWYWWKQYFKLYYFKEYTVLMCLLIK